MTEAERRAQGYRTHDEVLIRAKGSPLVFHQLHMHGQDWYCAPFVKKVIISPPATIILWQDGTKTVCKCSEGEEFDIEKGIAMCFLKKMFGNPSQVRKFIDKWMKENSVECSQHLIEGKKAYTGNATKLTEDVYMADYSKLTGFFDLVFCKDCKYFHGLVSVEKGGICNKHFSYMDDEDFCSKGEKEE